MRFQIYSIQHINILNHLQLSFVFSQIIYAFLFLKLFASTNLNVFRNLEGLLDCRKYELTHGISQTYRYEVVRH